MSIRQLSIERYRCRRVSRRKKLSVSKTRDDEAAKSLTNNSLDWSVLSRTERDRVFRQSADLARNTAVTSAAASSTSCCPFALFFFLQKLQTTGLTERNGRLFCVAFICTRQCADTTGVKPVAKMQYNTRECCSHRLQFIPQNVLPPMASTTGGRGGGLPQNLDGPPTFFDGWSVIMLPTAPNWVDLSIFFCRRVVIP